MQPIRSLGFWKLSRSSYRLLKPLGHFGLTAVTFFTVFPFTHVILVALGAALEIDGFGVGVATGVGVAVLVAIAVGV